jgi:threonine/homoserine/homoserine lactone efflux protein
MQHLPEIFGIATALAAGAVSAGPSFVMVARTSSSMGRLQRLVSRVGNGVWRIDFATASLLGLHGVLLAVPSLYLLLKVGGGLYLAYLGFRIWRGVTLLLEIQHHDRSISPSRFLLLGLTTQLSNRKRRLSMPAFCRISSPDSSLSFKVVVALLVF